MVTRRSFLALLGAAGAVAAGGGTVMALLPDSGQAVDGPPRIRFGAEPCARCTMIIGDERFAAGWRDQSGAETHFDDIGCMAVHAREHAASGTTRYWVHDYSSKEWVTAETASFVTDPSIKSPMAYGVAAASSQEGAMAIAAAPAQSWTVLLDTVKART